MSRLAAATTLAVLGGLAAASEAQAQEAAALECRLVEPGDMRHQKCEISANGRAAECLVATGREAFLGVNSALGWGVVGNDSKPLGAKDSTSPVKPVGSRQVAIPPGDHDFFCADPLNKASPAHAALHVSVREGDIDFRDGTTSTERIITDEEAVKGYAEAQLGGMFPVDDGRDTGGFAFAVSGGADFSHRSGATGERTSPFSGGFDVTAFGAEAPQREIIIHDKQGREIARITDDARIVAITAGLMGRICSSREALCLALAGEVGGDINPEDGGRFAVLGKASIGLRVPFSVDPMTLRSDTRSKLGLRGTFLGGRAGDDKFVAFLGGLGIDF